MTGSVIDGFLSDAPSTNILVTQRLTVAGLGSPISGVLQILTWVPRRPSQSGTSDYITTTLVGGLPYHAPPVCNLGDPTIGCDLNIIFTWQVAPFAHRPARMDDQAATTPSNAPDYRAVAGTRRYRSKAQRPCDLCRARKVLCNIPDPSRPCQLCRRIGRECTFVGNPGRRQPAKASSVQLESPPSVTGSHDMSNSAQDALTNAMEMSSPDVPMQRAEENGTNEHVLNMNGTCRAI